MQTKITCFILILMLYAGASRAQDSYQFLQTIDETVVGGHGLAVDTEGKIWYAGHDDSLGIRCLNPDLTPASFSPIMEVTIDGQTYITAKNCKGMNVDHEGNIVVVMQSVELFRINYKDGTVMNHVNLNDLTGVSVVSATRPAIDASGRIYFGKVVPGLSAEEPFNNPIWILNPDFTLANEVVADSQKATWWSRAMEVTPDGKNVFMSLIFSSSEPETNTFNMIHWTSDDGVGSYVLDSELYPPQPPAFYGGALDAMAWDREGKLAIGDNGWDCVWFYDLESGEYDQMVFGFGEPGEIAYPRGIAFSVTNDTIYVLDADLATQGLKMYSRGATGLKEISDKSLPVEFSLSQNYPNPFNPATKINFGIPEAGQVKVKIYDIIGREVATVLNDKLSAGNYEVDFNGTGLSSGIYLYELSSANARIVKKMTLLK